MKKLIIIPMLLICLIASGTNYYIKNSGNDSNSGLSDAQALAHHPWMSTFKGSVILKPGDVVYMNSGDIWTIANPSSAFITVKQNGSQESPITTTRYGSGAKPKINISTSTAQQVIFGSAKSFISFDNLDISHFDDGIIAWNNYTGIDIYNSSHDWVITNCDIHNCPSFGIYVAQDAYNLTIGNIEATTTATTTSYSNQIYDIGFSAISMAGCNLSTGVSNFNVIYNYIHDVNINGSDSENSYGISFASGSSSADATSNCFVSYNYISDIPTWTGIDVHNGKNMYILNNYIHDCKLGIGCQAVDKGGPWSPVLSNLNIDGNTIENSTDHIYSDYYFTQVSGATIVHIGGNNFFYTSVPQSESKAYGIKIDNVSDIIIDGNNFHNGPPSTSQGALDISSGNQNITISNNFISKWHYAILVNPSSFTGFLNIYNNIIHSQAVAIGTADQSGTFNGNINIYNNDIIISPISTYSEPIRFAYSTIGSGKSVKIKNNILGFNAAYSQDYFFGPSTINGTLEINNNIYWNSTAASPFNIGSKVYSFSSWNSLGYDADSYNNTDPLFQNTSGTYSDADDFIPKNTSPGINKGSNVGLSTDYYGAPISGNPDIGAIELKSIVAAPIPLFVSSVIQNNSPSVIGVVFDLPLANIVPAASVFKVTVNSLTRIVNSVAISGTTANITLASPVKYGDVLSISYTKPSSNPIQTPAGGQASSFNSKAVTNNVQPEIPVYLNSSVQSSTPSRLDITFNLSMANIIPAASSFNVTVNSVVRTVSSVSISGQQVFLNLASMVIYGDVVSISYNKPSTNPLQTPSGGQAVSFSANAVLNNITSSIPVYQSSAIQNSTPSRLDMTFNLSLANILPAVSSFKVTVNSVARNINSITISGTQVFLTLASPVIYADVVTVAYTKPTSGPLQTATGGTASSFIAQPVSNNCTPASNKPPVISISSPGKGVTFSAPASISISATASDPDGTIKKVEFYQGTTKLGEMSAAPFLFIWKNVTAGSYSITAVVTDNLNAATVSAPVTVSVTSIITGVNQLPVLTITSPSNGQSFVINSPVNITVDAYDPDGSVMEVNYYNGSVKIGSNLQPPYSLIFNGTTPGTYSLRVVAMDSKNDTTSVSLSLNLIKSDENQDKVNLYPNPNAGIFTLSSAEYLTDGNYTLSVISQQGKILYETLIKKDDINGSYDLTHLKPGLYILILAIKNNIFCTRKFVKN